MSKFEGKIWSIIRLAMLNRVPDFQKQEHKMAWLNAEAAKYQQKISALSEHKDAAFDTLYDKADDLVFAIGI
jgi:hypothetical protein